MGRSSIRPASTPPPMDGGAVLISLIQGEQDILPVTVSFVDNLNSYELEAVCIEGLNLGDGQIPTMLGEDPVKDSFEIFVPAFRGNWSSSITYTQGDFVIVSGVYYRRTGNTASNTSNPTTLVGWEIGKPNTCYVRLPKTLSLNWSMQPGIGLPCYGFFELRITETTAGGTFKRTWKPTRGVIEVRFSPTELVN
jgi:hypothetical protein